MVNPDIDQDNWLNNVPNQPSGPEAGLNVTTAFRVPTPEDPSLSKTYYNQREKRFYYVTRTLAKNPKSYDETQGSEASANLNNADFYAKKQILKLQIRLNLTKGHMTKEHKSPPNGIKKREWVNCL